MPVYLLYIKAELQNVARMKLDAGASFCIDVQEPGGGDIREGVHVDPGNEEDMPGGKGIANYVMKWKDSKKDASISVGHLKAVTKTEYTEDNDRKFVPIMSFECRGLTPVAFRPEAGWEISSTKGTKFEDVDMSDNEWSDYCEKLGEPVGVEAFESKFEVHRG